MKSCAGTYYVTVIEDTNSSQIIGTATLVVEHKFIHSTGQVKKGELSGHQIYSDSVRNGD